MDIGKKCGADTELTAYLYGEMPVSVVEQFEEHLADCEICADEFAAISFARYSVYEWNKAEFAPLETPVIRIETAESRGWLTALKGFFVPAPGFAFGAAGVIVAAVFGLAYLGSSDSGSEVAAVPTQPEEPAIVEEISVQPERVDMPYKASSETPADLEPTARPVKVKASMGRTKAAPAKRSINRSTTPPPAIAINAQAEEPRLNEFDDLDGDGLRLADLVADLDSE